MAARRPLLLSAPVLAVLLALLCNLGSATADAPSGGAAIRQSSSPPLADQCPDHHRRDDHDDRRCRDGSSGGQPNVPPPPPPYVPNFGPPSTPTNLQAYTASPGSLSFTWASGGGQVDGFWVYAPTPSPVEEAVSGTSVTLSNLTPGLTYCITVLAYNAAGFSSWSSWGCGMSAAYQPAAVSTCPLGYVLTQQGCVPPPAPGQCPAGYVLLPNGACEP